MSDLVGRVTSERYQELVEAGRELVASPSTCQFQLGDLALEVEPMGPRGGSRPHDAGSAEATLIMFAQDIGVSESSAPPRCDAGFCISGRSPPWNMPPR